MGRSHNGARADTSSRAATAAGDGSQAAARARQRALCVAAGAGHDRPGARGALQHSAGVAGGGRAALRRGLERVQRTRAVQRSERERAAIPTIALVGYTNAGKSTLLNALTHADVGVRDGLFHTLDPTIRSLRLSGRPYLLTDTVGFISKLPHQLIDAFAATLEETRRADLLVHVLAAPASEARAAEMQRAVEQTLAEIGANERPRLLAVNKVDLLDEAAREELRLHNPDAVLVSGHTDEGLAELGERVEAALQHSLRRVELLVPYAEGGS